MPARRVFARFDTPRPAPVRVIPQRYAAGATLAKEFDGGPGPILLGSSWRAAVPARRAEQDEKVLRPISGVQRSERGMRVLGPARRG